MKIKFTQDKIIRRLRWVAAFVILLDGGCTLLGQPPEYWTDAREAMEYNPFVRLLLIRGWELFVLIGLLYTCAAISVASVVPKRIGLGVLFTLLFCHFRGASSWMLWNFGFSEFQANFVGLCIGTLVAIAIGGTNRVNKPEPWIGLESAATASRALD